MNTTKDQVFRIYERTINKIDDATEYMHVAPDWLATILEDMHTQLEAFRNTPDTN